MKKILAFWLCIFVTGSAGWAFGAYVTDTLEVTVRIGPSTQNKVLTTPSSGQPLRVLETQGEWSRVRLLQRERSGEEMEGWMLSRYIITRPPWELQARQVTEQNASLKEKLTKVEQESKGLKEREAELAGKLAGATSALEKLQAQYDALSQGAAEYLTLKKDFESARSVLETNRRTLEALSQENRELKSTQRERWVMTGAGILLLGLLLGLIMARVRRKKSSLYS